jgi:hypothetical protein
LVFQSTGCEFAATLRNRRDMTETTETPVNLSQAGASVGRHKATVSRYVSSGSLQNYGTSTSPLVLVSELRALIDGGLDIAKRRKAVSESEARPEIPAGMETSLAAERIAKTRAERLRVERENAEHERELVERRAVEDAGVEIGVELRTLMDQRRAALAQTLAGGLGFRPTLAAIEQADADLLTQFERLLTEKLRDHGAGNAAA